MVRWIKSRKLRRFVIAIGLASALAGVGHHGASTGETLPKENFAAVVSHSKSRRMQKNLQAVQAKEIAVLEKETLPKPEKHLYTDIQNNYDLFIELIKEYDFYSEEYEAITQEAVELDEKHHNGEIDDQKFERGMKELAADKDVVAKDAREVLAEIKEAHEEHKTLIVKLEQLIGSIIEELESDPTNQALQERLQDCQDSYSDLSRISLYFEAYQ